jgi:hypothetical protein
MIGCRLLYALQMKLQTPCMYALWPLGFGFAGHVIIPMINAFRGLNFTADLA